MRRKDRLLAKAKNNQTTCAFVSLKLCFPNAVGSLTIRLAAIESGIPPRGYRLPIQSKRSQAKGYQVKEFLRQYDEETDNE